MPNRARRWRRRGLLTSGASLLDRTGLPLGAGLLAGRGPFGDPVTRGDLARGGRVEARWRHEHGLTVVTQFLDALGDVGQGPVPAALGRAGEVSPRVPAPGELLDARHIHHPVVQERI